MNRKMQKIAGFTLIELLVVVAIIAVLVSILLPALSSARETARRVACASNLHQVYMGFSYYNEDHKELPPFNWGSPFLIVNGAQPDGTMGDSPKVALKKKYGITKQLVTCPSSLTPLLYDDTYGWDGNPQTMGQTTYVGFCGKSVSTQPDGPGYCNGWPLGAYFPMANQGFYPRLSLTESKLYREGGFDRMPLLLDGACYNPPPYYILTPQRANHSNGTGVLPLGENVLFLDGHQEWQRLALGKSWIFAQAYPIGVSAPQFWLTNPGPPSGLAAQFMCK